MLLNEVLKIEFLESIENDVFIVRVIAPPTMFSLPYHLLLFVSIITVHSENFVIDLLLISLFQELGFKLGPSLIFTPDVNDILVSPFWLLFEHSDSVFSFCLFIFDVGLVPNVHLLDTAFPFLILVNQIARVINLNPLLDSATLWNQFIDVLNF